MAPDTSTVLLKEASSFTVKVLFRVVASVTSKVEWSLVDPDTSTVLLKEASSSTVKVSFRVVDPSTSNEE